MVRMSDLDDEADKIAALLVGMRVRGIKRHRYGEVLIEFEDGTRLFVNSHSNLEFSITGGQSDTAHSESD